MTSDEVKRVFKTLANGGAWVLVVLPYGAYRIAAAVVGAERAFPGWSQLFSLIPGQFGNYLRRAFYRLVLPCCGRDACISFGTVFSHPTASIGDRVYIGIGCMIGDVTFEADVLVGSHVSIINGRRQHGIERMDVPVRDQPGEYPRVVIGRDAWIGDRAVVTTNVGRQAVVGAAAVVVKAVPDTAIVAGNPATIRGFRGEARQASSGATIGAAVAELEQELQTVATNLEAGRT